MAYYDTIKLVSGDDLPQLEIILRDSNTAVAGATLDITAPTTWKPIDLTNASAVKMKIRPIGSTTLTATLNCVVQSPKTDGKVLMDWGLTTLDITAGDYEGEIELTYSSGKVLTVPDLLRFDLRGQF